MKENKKSRWIFLFMIGATLLLTVLIYFFMPVSYTVDYQVQDPVLTPASPVLTLTPLQQCFNGEFKNISSIDILFGTYARSNTNHNHLEVYTLVGGKKQTLYQTDFSSSSVKDNEYFPIPIPNISSESNFCFTLDSKDGTVQNSITYWLNTQNQPVLRIRSILPFYKAMKQLHSASRFHLPIWLAITLCLMYLGGNIFALFLIWYVFSQVCYRKTKEVDAETSSAHSGRAGKK